MISCDFTVVLVFCFFAMFPEGWLEARAGSGLEGENACRESVFFERGWCVLWLICENWVKEISCIWWGEAGCLVRSFFFSTLPTASRARVFVL